MKNDIISVNIKQITLFKEEAGKLFFKPEAEEQLIKLLKLKNLIEKAVEKVKSQIKEAGEKTLGVDFRGVIGDKVRVIKKFYGQKYEIADENLASDFIENVIVKKIKTEEVDEYLKNEGELPAGIEFKDREQSLSIVLKEK